MISIYRLVNDIETVCCSVSEKSAMYKEAIMGVWEVQIGVVTEAELDIQTGDYLKYNGVNYTLNRDDEFTQKSDVEWVYYLIFEHPLYTLLDKLITNPLTGASTFQLTGKLIDFVDIVVWNTNKTVANPLGIDTGWTRGSIIDTDYKNISFSSVSCRDVLTMLSTEFNVEFLLANKQINYVERIENATGLTFIQGKGNGLYEVTKQNVDKGDTITRIHPVGGNKNVPNANADEQGYLKLPEIYLENTSEIKRIVEKRVVFEDIFPFFLGSITSVGGTNSAEIICNDIDFNLTDIAVGSEARVNFLTGDLMGCSFEFQWNNALKKLTLIEQKDETALADAAGNKPTVPSALKKAKAGDKFNFTGVIMPVTYVNNAITKLRLKATDWLSFYSRKRIKFDVQIDNRWMRGKTDLKAGDLVTIKIPQKNIESLLRIVSLDKNLHTGKISATVSNYLDEKWEKKVEGALSSLQTTVQTGLAGVGNVDILQNYDARPASDNNVMSSLRSRNEFLSAKEPDTAAERITFQKGAVVRDLATPDFVQDKFAGAGAAIYEDEQGNTVIEADIMTVRKTAYFSEVQINQIRFQGGIMVYSAANLEVLSVADGGSYLQLNFDTKNGQIANQFVVDDQIRCQQLSGMTMIKYYMSRVTSVGADYIRISKTDIDGTLNASIGDQVVQFGNRTNTARQSLIEVNVVDGGKQTFYQGVNSYNLIDKNAIEIGRVYDNSEWKTMMRLYGDLFIGDRNLSSYFKYNSTTKQMELAAHVLFKSGETYKEVGVGIADAKTEAVQLASNDATTKANTAKDTAISTASTDATNKSNAAIQTAKEYSDAKVAVINQSLTDLQTQSDGAVSNWPSNTQTEAPTLSNFPANQWTSNTERDRHILDVYTNYQEYVSDAATPNAGKSWKFVKSEAGIYSWALIADNNQSKAYLMSVKATAIANQKITTFSTIPNMLMADGFCYRKGDLWSLQAAWNGFTAGELLSAAQDSTSFVSGDWTKWVKYTDDTAVKNLEQGGVNLILDSLVNSSVSADYGLQRTSNYPLKVGKSYTLVVEGYCDTLGANNGVMCGILTSYEAFVVFDSTSLKKYILKFVSRVDTIIKCWVNRNSGSVFIKNYALYEGDIPVLYWTPAPEDTQSKIDEAKLAGTNAQNSADTANSSVGSLNTYVDTTFKTGVVGISEAQSIDKLNKQVNTDFDKAIIDYNVVYANGYLTGSAKTDLLNAKVSFAGAKDNLQTSINTAIADGITTITEKADVDSKFAAYKSTFTDYQTKLSNANKAIQQQLDSLAQNKADSAQSNAISSATTKINNLEQGGINLILDSIVNSSMSSDFGLQRISNYQFKVGKSYTFVVEGYADVLGAGNGAMCGILPSYEAFIIFDSTTTKKYTLKFSATRTGVIKCWVNRNSGSIFIKNYAVYEGDIPVLYWTPAPEDTQAKITALDHLKLAFGGSTEVNGGVVALNVMLLKNLQGAITGGLSGLSTDNVCMWQGGTYQQAIDSASNPAAVAGVDRKDGSGHRAFGKLSWDKFGNLMVGAFKIIAGAITGYEGLFERVRITTTAITPLQSLLSGGWEIFPDRYRNDSTPSFVSNSDNAPSQEIAIVSISSSISIPAATSLKLYSGGSLTYSLANNNGVTYSGISERFEIDGVGNYTPTASGTTISIAAGEYNISYVIEVVFDVEANGSSDVYISNSQEAYVEVQSTTPSRTEIGNNGFMSFWTSLNYFFFDKTNGCKGRGSFDIPAGLGGASVTSSGSVSGIWGKITSGSQISKLGNNYTITHNIGDTDYTIIPIADSANIPYRTSRTANTIVIVCAGGFDFILVRTK